MLSPYIELDQNLQLVSARFGISRATGSRSPKRAASDLSTFDQFKLLAMDFALGFSTPCLVLPMV